MDLSVWSASAAVVLLSGYVWQKFCKSQPPWSKEIAALGQPRKKRLSGTAVVCGGSISGTVTARLLADHFERVVVVDPEIGSEKKTRIMQYNAGHLFLHLFAAGARRLWPNFDEEFQAAGGRVAPADTQLHFSGLPILTPWPDYAEGCFPDTIVTRRSTAQKVLSTLLRQHPTAERVTLLPGTVRSIQPSSDMSSIQSVTVRKLDGTQEILNDVALVADCTGAIQGGVKWLNSAGYALPEDIRRTYNGNLRYVTICFFVPPELGATLPIPEHARKAAMIYAYGPHFDHGSTVLGFFRTDNDTYQVLVGDAGTEDDVLPKTASDLVPFLKTFNGYYPIPHWLIEAVDMLCKNADNTFDSIKIPTQSFIQYHRLPTKALPSNFVVVGDASLQLNPVHGQGFSKIILNAAALNSLLRSANPAINLPRDFSAHYFKKNAAYTHGLWDATRLHDYGTSGCEPMVGETKEAGRLIRWFELKLVAAAIQDYEVASALWHARHLLAADRVLLAPTVLWKIFTARSPFYY
ncbi:hypothetical protein R3P38DRAFT_3295319 [Favolaschia claudopus]|uniref:Squalene monooxygenase n=1 Tax=Favolaschia claudopus TaxID=2862362 RepID=A0AAV9ZC80_9AGAR